MLIRDLKRPSLFTEYIVAWLCSTFGFFKLMWGFMICTPQQILLVYQIRGNDMVGGCGTCERGNIHTTLQRGYVTENHLEDLSVEGIIVLKLNLEK